MEKSFKLVLIPYLFDNGRLVTYMLQDIPNWPQIDMKKHFDDDESYSEPLDTENCEFVDYTDDTLIISCGNEHQSNYTIVIGYFIENGFFKIGVIDVQEDEYREGIDYDMFEALFYDLIEFIPKELKSIQTLTIEMEQAVRDEEYLLAAQLQKEIKALEDSND